MASRSVTSPGAGDDAALKALRLARQRRQLVGAARGGIDFIAAPRQFERDAAPDAGARAGHPGGAVGGFGAVGHGRPFSIEPRSLRRHDSTLRPFAARLDAAGAAMEKTGPTGAGAPMRVTLIDNYDSFTFNLVHYLGELGADVSVWRNDEISRRRRAGARAGRDRALARPLHAQRSGNLPRSRARGERYDADPRRVPRPSGDRPGFRRRGRARARADARQGVAAYRTTRGASFAASTARSRRRATTR